MRQIFACVVHSSFYDVSLTVEQSGLAHLSKSTLSYVIIVRVTIASPTQWLREDLVKGLHACKEKVLGCQNLARQTCGFRDLLAAS
jgi:hypothetical protein